MATHCEAECGPFGWCDAHRPALEWGTWAVRGGEMSPTVGRMVHYVSLGSRRGEEPEGEHHAAVVTKVSEDGASADLWVLAPREMRYREGVVEDPSPTPATGTWHWPERE